MRNDASNRASTRVDLARNWPGGDAPAWSIEEIAELVPPAFEDPQATVITPCHDDGRFLLDAVASVRRCADERLAMIVVDDHSTDPETLTILDALRATTVRVVSAEGTGPAAARNAALALVTTDFVVPLDADNIIRPGYVSAACGIFDERPMVAAVHGDAERFGLESAHWPAETPTVADLLCGNKLDTCAVLRASALDAIGGWDPDLVASEDWGLWIALLDAGWELATVPLVGYDYRVRDGSLRGTLTSQVRYEHLMHLVRRHPRLYREHLEAVIANFAGALVVPGEGDDDGFALRRDQDRIASLESELARREDASVEARRRAAEAIRGRDERDERIEEIERERDAATAEVARLTDQLHATEALVTAYEETRLFRLARRPREVYGKLRRPRG